MVENTAQPEITRKKRPLFLWFYMFNAVFGLGLFPLGLAVFALIFYCESWFHALSFIYSILLCLGITVFGTQVFFGKKRAVKIFLILLILYYIGRTINIVYGLWQGEFPEDQLFQNYARVFRGVVYPFLYVYYLNRPGVKAYFD